MLGWIADAHLEHSFVVFTQELQQCYDTIACGRCQSGFPSICCVVLHSLRSVVWDCIIIGSHLPERCQSMCRAATVPLYGAFGHQCNHQFCASEGSGPHCKSWSNVPNLRLVPVELHVRAQHRFYNLFVCTHCVQRLQFSCYSQ